jgi:hypothetical protein
MALLAVVLAGLLPAVPASAGAAPARVDATQQEVYDALEVSDVPIHFEILVDDTYTMARAGNYGKVLKALAPVVDAMGPLDSVGLVNFDVVQSYCFFGRAVPSKEMLGCLPKRPEGMFTNLGAAILGSFENFRGNGAAVNVLVVASDVDRRPGTDKDTIDPVWRTISPAAKKITELHAYSLAVGDLSSINDLRTAIPGATKLKPDAATVKGVYEKLRQDVRAKRLRTLLSPDMAKPVTFSWETELTNIDPGQGVASVKLTLATTTAKVPLVLTNVSLERIEGDENVVAASLPDTVELKPGLSEYYYVEFSWPKPPDIRFTSQFMAVHATFRLHATVSSPWDTVLTAHKLTRATPLKGKDTVAVSGERTVGPPVMRLTLLGVGILAVLFLIFLIAMQVRRRRGAHRRARF